MKVFILDDNLSFVNTLKKVLLSNGFEVCACFNVSQALQELKTNYDFYLLDVILPDGNGIELCSYIRTFSNNPIIMISSSTEEYNIINSLSLGADNYIEKPFRMNVLIAKMEAALRRCGKLNNFVKFKDIILDFQNQTFQHNEFKVDLTKTEISILNELFKCYPNRVQRERLIACIFDSTGNMLTDLSLNVRMSELKKKLGNNSFHIESKRYLGYRWVD